MPVRVRARSLAGHVLAIALALAVLVGDSSRTPLGRMWHHGEAFAAGLKTSSGPDLGVSMIRVDTDDRPMIAAGQTLTLSIGVDNLRGGAAAHASVLKVTLPAGLDLVQATPPASSVNAGKELTWELGTVEAGAFPRIFELTLASAENLSAGAQLTVAATIATSDGGASPKNNSSIYTVLVQPRAAVLAVESNLTSVPVTVDSPVKFTAAVDNLGTVAAAASALTLTLPPMVSFKSSDPAPAATTANSITWQLGDIAANDSRTIAIMVALDMRLAAVASEPGPESPLKFKLDASTSTTDLDPAASHLEIDRRVEMAGPNLKVWLSVQGADTPGELPIGKDVTYTIEYGNFGNAPAQHGSVSLSLWEGLSLLRAEPAPTGTSNSDRFGGGVLSWDVGDLHRGQSGIIKSQVHVASVPEDGSLVVTTISAPGANISSGESTAYSLRHASRAAERETARGGHTMLWLFLIAVLAMVLWVVVRRARSKPAS
jgi:uncharacterized repeat protein (TIGR01451 family)